MATCTYCQLALDGWESGDKPMFVLPAPTDANAMASNFSPETSTTSDPLTVLSSRLSARTNHQPRKGPEARRPEAPKPRAFLCNPLLRPHLISPRLPT